MHLKLNNSYLTQIFASIFGALATFTTGQYIGWVSPSIPTLESDISVVPGGISTYESSWILVVGFIGNVLATVLVAFVSDIFGRKRMILFSTLPVFLSWILIYMANRLEILYGARFIGGFGETMGKATMFMYIGEIAEAKIRGALGTILVITINLGVLFEYALGPFLSFPTLALISSTIPILLFSTFIFMPESPYYHVMNGDDANAKKSLQYLRCKEDVTDELFEIKSIVETKLCKMDALKLLLTVKKNRNTLLLMIGIFATQELSGITPNVMYAEKILQETNISFIRTDLVPIILPLVKIVATLFTTVLVDKVGRRPLFILSAITCAFTLTLVSGYFYLLEVGKRDLSHYGWIPVITITCYNFLFILGFGCLPFILIGELFQTNVKAIAVSITAFFVPITSAIVTNVFQILFDEYGRYAAFGYLAISCYLCFLFITIFLPETKNKSLAQLVQNKLYT